MSRTGSAFRLCIGVVLVREGKESVPLFGVCVHPHGGFGTGDAVTDRAAQEGVAVVAVQSVKGVLDDVGIFSVPVIAFELCEVGDGAVAIAVAVAFAVAVSFGLGGGAGEE